MFENNRKIVILLSKIQENLAETEEMNANRMQMRDGKTPDHDKRNTICVVEALWYWELLYFWYRYSTRCISFVRPFVEHYAKTNFFIWSRNYTRMSQRIMVQIPDNTIFIVCCQIYLALRCTPSTGGMKLVNKENIVSQEFEEWYALLI